ncbi:MAG: LysR family transcriptional regulator [Bradyrhizobiaceae bacterium]|nr:LysR family transcriptional regulator [Bradyrhizobiaceae bacterium]
MDTLTNIRAFLSTVELGSFSAAARRLNVAPSVITKRVNQLEHEVKRKLFERSTRKLQLIDSGASLILEMKALIKGHDRLVQTKPGIDRSITGHLRIKSPTVLGRTWAGRVFGDFLRANRNVTGELVLLNRSVNPNEENFDVALSLWPSAFQDTIEIPLYHYPRVLVASPSYIKKHGMPSHPSDLREHDCINLISTGKMWIFSKKQNVYNVEIAPRLSVSDADAIRMLAIYGHGLVLVSEISTKGDIDNGKLVPCMRGYIPASFNITARVPKSRVSLGRVKAFIKALQQTPFGPKGGRFFDPVRPVGLHPVSLTRT